MTICHLITMKNRITLCLKAALARLADAIATSFEGPDFEQAPFKTCRSSGENRDFTSMPSAHPAKTEKVNNIPPHDFIKQQAKENVQAQHQPSYFSRSPQDK